MSTTTTSSKRSSTSSRQSSTPASPGFASTFLSQWKDDTHVTGKENDVVERLPRVSRDFHAGRRVLPSQTCTKEDRSSRFIIDEDGSHEHNIHDYKGHSKSLSMTYHLTEQRMLHLASKVMKGFRKEEEPMPTDNETIASATAQTFAEKYGRCGHVLGAGAFGIVRVAHKISKDDRSEHLFAVKQLAQRQNESPKKYHKRITAEFCISSALKHPNVVSTLDLLQDDKDIYCQVMEYCSGGDLHTTILAAVELEESEADCFFKQIMRGVAYMHEMGVAHRDLKPENILLTHKGIIKITDFGNAECFRTAWETEAQRTQGVCGSAPYIAPEVYTDSQFDARATDVWAAGCIYMAMRTGRLMWREARTGKDATYAKYVEARKTDTGYAVLENLRVSVFLFMVWCEAKLIRTQRTCRNVIYSTLDPNAKRRLTAHQVVCSEWMQRIRGCEAGTCAR